LVNPSAVMQAALKKNKVAPGAPGVPGALPPIESGGGKLPPLEIEGKLP
jgi:hypothetical protein